MKLETIAVKNLNRRKGKMLLVVAGLAVAVATLVSVASIVLSFQRTIDRQLDEYGYNIVVYPRTNELSIVYGNMVLSSLAPEEIKPLHDRNLAAINRLSEARYIKSASPKTLVVASVRGRDVLVGGVSLRREREIKRWWQIEAGRFPAGSNELLVGLNASDKLGLSAGDALVLGGREFRVAGILMDTGSADDDLIFGDIEAVRSAFNRPGEISLIEVAARRMEKTDLLVKAMKRALPGASVVSVRQAVKYKQNAMEQFARFGLAITGVVVLISALIVFTTMASSVNERRAEIGIFRAIGYRQTQVARIILSEAVLLGLGSGVGGFALGLGLAQLLRTMSGAIRVSVTPSLFLLFVSVVISITIGVVASLLPAWRAAKLDPADALKNL